MNIDRIRAFVHRLKPNLECDHCIADRLDIAGTTVCPATNELAGRTELVRAVGTSTLCQTTRQTLQAH